MERTEPAEGSSQAAARPRGRRLRKALLWVQWSIDAAVLVAAVLVWTPAGNWVERRLIAVDPLAKADYIVVLGGGYSRAVEAANLYRDGWASKVIVSSRGPQANVLSRIAQSYGVPQEAILVDPLAGRTADHPHTVQKLPGLDRQADRFLIVTSPLHTSRAQACFQHAGFRNVRMRVPNWQAGGRFDPRRPGRGTRLGDLPTMMRELLAWAYYKLRGWL